MSEDGTVELVLYTAPDCCLCEEARAVLTPVALGSGFSLKVVDISLDPLLEQRYRERIPVGEIGGRLVFKYHVDLDRLQRLIAETRAMRWQGARHGRRGDARST